MLKGERHFDEAGKACSTLGMTDDGLHRAHVENTMAIGLLRAFVVGGKESSADSLGLNWITRWGSWISPMSLKKLWSVTPFGKI
ncbi:hypothetical protein M7I_4616 [Glarea lozoyensis 74030]|uniref:Uncharacterized protein n=1 Tax=Glarea lozoyensis (strain ATCC 74030 / MF5533) TaxID=1104152 RepID=H0EPN1_GLAL7|nr:hypothetical protein M7I_4616 [Glarea lozoyensis 74030]